VSAWEVLGSGGVGGVLRISGAAWLRWDILSFEGEGWLATSASLLVVRSGAARFSGLVFVRIVLWGAIPMRSRGRPELDSARASRRRSSQA